MNFYPKILKMIYKPCLGVQRYFALWYQNMKLGTLEEPFQKIKMMTIFPVD